MKTKRTIVYGIFAVILALAYTACGDGGGSGGSGGSGGDPGLSGTITITPAGPVTFGIPLIANYTGTETVSYQWKRDGRDISRGTGTTYTPQQAIEAGSYTVTVSAAGYTEKTSVAVIVTEESQPMPGSDSNLAQKLAWVKNAVNVQSGQTYTIEVTADETIRDQQSLSYTTSSGEISITIILKGIEEERVISYSNSNAVPLFSMSKNGVTLILDENITLKSRSSRASLVSVSGGTLVMKAGAKITENQISPGVSVGSNGTFTMDGGEISGNRRESSSSSARGGGVYVASNGTFIMNDGKISGNRAYHTSNNTSYTGYGGGVYVDSNGTFTMNGGEISGNYASDNRSASSSGYGGGVYVASNGTFIMNDGEISGNTSINGSGVCLAGTFTMNGGEISGNTGIQLYSNYGGGVYVNSGTFRIVTGTVYGSDASEELRNTASNGAGLYVSTGTAQRGTFDGETWNSKDSLSTTNDTIMVEDGELQ